MDYVAEMGFDVLYLPPVSSHREELPQGQEQSPEAAPGEVGSPWAIGSAEGGHTAIHPAARHHGRLRRPRRAGSSECGLEIALDIAFQCSPDHPWVTEHPEFFKKRPDGSIQYAENPPKKYQDIYPLDFESSDWRGSGMHLKGVFSFWIGKGVRIFRVDNPHTKAFPFWEWVIRELKAEAPGGDVSGGGLHPAARDGTIGQARVFPVLYLLHLAQYQRRADASTCANSPRTRCANISAPIFGPTRPISFRRPATGRAARLSKQAGAGGHAGGKLWDLWPGLRAGREHARESGKRRILELGEVRDQAMGFAIRPPASSR